MNITIEVLGRSAVDRPFTTLVAPAVLAMPGGSLGYTPSLPTGSDGLELRLRVGAPESLQADVGQWLDPARPPQATPLLDGSGVQTGMAPAPTPYVTETYGIWGGSQRDIPFGRNASARFRRVGVAA